MKPLLALPLAALACHGVDAQTVPLPCAGVDVTANARCGLRHALAFLDAEQVRDDAGGKEARLAGEWPSFLRWVPAPRERGQVVYDSNAFVALSIAWPLTLLDDTRLPPEARRVTSMRTRALTLVRSRYRHDRGEVNFWPVTSGFHGPPRFARRLPPGMGHVFDIANDADDTALLHAVAERVPADAEAAALHPAHDWPALFVPWRDVDGRRRGHPRDRWKPRASGAFLTWLADEQRPDTRMPLWPALPNTVDCVVLANVVLALGPARGPGTAGYAESCALTRDVAALGAYPACAHYYPSRWMFPYAFARSLGAGNACLDQETGGRHPAAELAGALLGAQGPDGCWVEDATADPQLDARSDHPDFRGDGRVLATALALAALRQLGPALDGDTQARIRTATPAAVRFLVEHAVVPRGVHGWAGGVFFSSSVGAIAYWKSPAYTTALVLEALTHVLADGTAPPLALGAADVPADWLAAGN